MASKKRGRNRLGVFSLILCMGLGCHAVGVSGCRIMDSKRERLVAMLTTALVPCNGRFPTLIALGGVFLTAGAGLSGSLGTAALLAAAMVGSVAMTLLCSKLLSLTVLRGEPSSFVLELPPYRMPKVGQVIWRSVWDRTLHMLGRAVTVAAPAGLLLWLLANLRVGELSLLAHSATLLEPVGRLFGMDGVILLAFLLALPANEIVLPVILMAYTASGALVEFESLNALKELLIAHGWTVKTAVCTFVFMLFHFPCATTLWTVKRESGRWRYVLLSAILPTACGLLLCLLINLIF